MEEKKIFVMTSIGPVPFDAVKEHLPKDVAKMIEDILNEEEPDDGSIEFYIDRLAKKKNWDYKKIESYLNKLETFSKVSVVNILLMEVAHYLDSKYEDSINKAEEIYVISTLDGKIHKVEGIIKNFRNFAAFRTIEDAKFAHKVLSKKIRGMFRGCGE